VRGVLTGSRIIPESTEPVMVTAVDLLEKIQKFRQELKS